MLKRKSGFSRQSGKWGKSWAWAFLLVSFVGFKELKFTASSVPALCNARLQKEFTPSLPFPFWIQPSIPFLNNNSLRRSPLHCFGYVRINQHSSEI
ncbi:hypothetical protein V6N11_006093 [Hibiscus sabdariffa]|uniref:Uncharacterized protein n=1 Tax=Hibiscus sabdariffa TaxID=183260 RepID=A0ABR2RPM9_9ROSI